MTAADDAATETAVVAADNATVLGPPPPPTPPPKLDTVVLVVVEFVDPFVVPATLLYFKLSQCVLYSIGVFGGKFKIRRNVSRIRFVQ